MCIAGAFQGGYFDEYGTWNVGKSFYEMVSAVLARWQEPLHFVLVSRIYLLLCNQGFAAHIRNLFSRNTHFPTSIIGLNPVVWVLGFHVTSQFASLSVFLVIARKPLHSDGCSLYLVEGYRWKGREGKEGVKNN
jgi:hypothetical protein